MTTVTPGPVRGPERFAGQAGPSQDRPSALQALGEPLFERFGLLALDDLDWFPLVGGGISALAQPTHALGVAAFERLQRRIDGDRSAPVQQTFGAELRIRQSTRART